MGYMCNCLSFDSSVSTIVERCRWRRGLAWMVGEGEKPGEGEGEMASLSHHSHHHWAEKYKRVEKCRPNANAF